MSDSRELWIEERILHAVKKLLSGRVNDILGELRYSIPAIEFSSYISTDVVCPSVVLSLCERTEKERLIFIDAYSLTIAFTLPETRESEMHCYTYAAAIKRAVLENPTLDGIVDRVVIAGIKYTPPKKPHCGEGWGVVISLRVTREEMRV